MVNEIDIKESMAMGLYSRPLTTVMVQKHLEDLGLEVGQARGEGGRGRRGGREWGGGDA